MESDLKDEKKKPYCHPTLTILTLEQAKKLVAKSKNCTQEEAAEFLKSLRRPPKDAGDQQRKRSA
jgi:hypothetical protein